MSIRLSALSLKFDEALCTNLSHNVLNQAKQCSHQHLSVLEVAEMVKWSGVEKKNFESIQWLVLGRFICSGDLS